MTDLPQTALVLALRPEMLGEFNLLLQQGFGVTAHVGCTLDKLLSRQWHIDPDYVANRITTIFLDGRAIDDVKTAVVREGSVVALSGAMPGLVGATMRRGGYYAPMRGAMTYQPTAGDVTDRIATVRVKLFNILLPELGPGFLQRGMILDASGLAQFFSSKGEDFWSGCISAVMNGERVSPPSLSLAGALPEAGTVRLTITLKVLP